MVTSLAIASPSAIFLIRVSIVSNPVRVILRTVPSKCTWSGMTLFANPPLMTPTLTTPPAIGSTDRDTTV